MSTIDARSLTSLSDDALLGRLAALLGQSRRVEAAVVAHIGEVDARRLYARGAMPSMFAYCTVVLHLSEAEAYLRITVARASRAHPGLLEMLADGRLHLSGIATLAPHLSPENRDGVLARAAHRSKREIEDLVAELAPRPDAPTVVRKVPERAQLRPDGVGAGPGAPAAGPVAGAGPPAPTLDAVPPVPAAQASAVSASVAPPLPRPPAPDPGPGPGAVQGPVHGERRALPEARTPP